MFENNANCGEGVARQLLAWQWGAYRSSGLSPLDDGGGNGARYVMLSGYNSSTSILSSHVIMWYDKSSYCSSVLSLSSHALHCSATWHPSCPRSEPVVDIRCEVTAEEDVSP